MATREDVLLSPLNELERALATSGRNGDWQRAADHALGSLLDALRRHTAEADAPGGMYAKADLTRPTLVHAAGVLRQDHRALRDKADALRADLQRGGAAAEALRARLEELVTALKRHRDQEADLMLESVNGDTGAGE